MKVETNIPLSTLTTMHLGGIANYVATVTTVNDVQQLYQNSQKLSQAIYVIGGGSNLIAHDEGFPGVIVLNRIMGIQVIADDAESTTIAAGSGETWDGLVAYSVDLGLSGIEAMSGIPGTVGAAPVQNIGAYGQELADTFLSLEAYDTQTNTNVLLTWEDCGFSYRHSIFRGREAGRYIITKVTLTLHKKIMEPPFYKSLQAHLDEKQVEASAITPQIIRSSVLSIRADKLPDPAQLPNTGSFFKNAIVENWQADDIRKNYDDMPSHRVDDEHVKIPAGWLIETAGLKGEVIEGMKVHEQNAVVLINESATSYQQLATAREEIINSVRDTFRIDLEQEPLEIPVVSS